jgi:hypothetical protein
MKKSYLNSERNTALFSKPSKAFRLLLMVLFVSIMPLVSFGQSQTFSYTGSPQTFTVPAGVTSITIAAWGGGGAGGGVTNSTRAGGGGEGGSFVRGTITVTPGATYTVVVGRGGQVSTGNGTAGGATSFGGSVLFNAIGGNGGAAGITGSTFGAGGNSASSGNVVSGTTTSNFYGGNGGTASSASTASSGGGGGSAGAGGNGGNGGVLTGGAAGAGSGTPSNPGIVGATGRGSANDGNGITGGFPGAGGSGGRNANNSATYTGGLGGNGQVIVTYTCPVDAGTLSGTQTVCIGGTTTFTSTVLGGTWGSGNTGIATIDINTGVITPVTAGGPITMTYTITGTGGCTTRTATRTVTVTANQAVTAASSTPTMCLGSALPTPITHTTSGATGIGTPTNLPAGVTASWSSNTITINGTPTTPGTFNYSIPLSGGCGSINATGTITVNGLPTATAGGTQTICQNGTATVSGATSSNGTIVWTENGAGSITSGATTLTPIYTAAAGDAGNTVTLTMTVSNSPCTAATATYSVIVKPLPTAAAGGTQTICINDTATVSGATSSNGTIAWTENGAGSITSGATTLTPTYTPAAGDAGNTVTLTMTVSNSPCSAATAIYSVIVKGQPTATAGGTQTICSNGTATVSGATSSNGTIAWTENGAGSITSGATTLTPIYTAAAGDAGSTVTLTMTVSNSPCTAATATYTVAVSANNTVTAASSSPVLCISTLMPDITHTTTGATGIGTPTNLPAGVTASWASNTITISGTPTAFGTFNYSIPLTGGCGSLNATGTITVNPNNTVGTASTTPTMCVNTALATAITHSTTGATGIGTPTNLPAGVTASWASNTITISGTPSISGVFSYSIPLTGGCGTVLYATGTITVEDPVADAGIITGTATVCQGQNGAPYSVPVIANATSYNWTLPTGATIASGANTNSITVNFAANASSGNIGVYGNNTCGNGVSEFFPVTVNTISTAPTGISGTTTICNGDSTTLTVTGGVIGIGATAEWFTDSCGGTSAGTGNSIIVSPIATTTYYVRYKGTCNTTTCTSVTVTVNTLSVAPTGIIGTSTICEGTSTTLSISGGSAGTAAVAQWFTGSCAGTSAGTGNSITVSPIVTTTYYVRYNGTCNTTTCASVTIIVDPLPIAAGTISGLSTVCQGQNGVTYSVPAIANATGYTWTLPTGATIVSGANSNNITVDYAANATSGNLTVKGTNTCGNGIISANFAVIVNPLPIAAGTITGFATVCQGQNGVVYFVPAIANATGYNWTLPTGASITAGTNTNTITVNYSTIAISGIITVQGTNSCGNGVISTNYPILVNPLPIAAGAITGLAIVCQGQNGVAYSVPSIANATGYTWTLPTGATITSGANTNSITVNYSVTATSGDITVLGTNACGNGVVSANYPVTVNPLPAAAGTITGSAVVCQGQTNIIYSVPVIANATTYTWTLPTGATIASGSGTNTIYVNYSMSASSGNITVQGNNACGNGVISANYAVTVNITPSINTNYSPTVCSGEQITVSPTNGGGNIVPVGTTYSWGLPSVTGGVTGATALSGQTSFVQTLVNPTNIQQTASYNVTATTGGCSATTFSVLVTVYPKPTVTGTPMTQPICSGAAITPITFSNPNGIAGTIDYNWTRNNTSNVTGMATSGSGTITGNLSNGTSSPQTTDFTVIATTQNGCNSLPFIVSVVVNPIPTIAAIPSTSQTICSGNTITTLTLSNPNGVTGTTYSWTRNNTTNITGIPDGSGTSITGSLTNTTAIAQTTIFTIKATANGCDSSTTTVSITVNPKPTVAVSIVTQTVCGGSPITNIDITNPNGVAGTTYTWIRDNTTNVTGLVSGSGTPIAGTLVNNTNIDQTTVFTVTASANGCPSTTTTTTVIVKPTPTVSVTNASQTICNATAIATVVVSNPNNVAGTTFSWTRTNTASLTGIAASGIGNITGTLTNNQTTTQTTTFTITATANGCSRTTTATVTVYAPLVAPVIGTSQTACVFATPAAFAILTPATGGSGSYTYQWQRSTSGNPGTFTNIGGQTGASYTAPTVGWNDDNVFYQLITTNACGSTTSNVVSIEPVNNGSISTNVPENIGTQCPGGTFTLSAKTTHLASSSARFTWTTDLSFITSPTYGPVGNSGGSYFFGLFRDSEANPLSTFTVQNNTNATVVTPITITTNVYRYGSPNPGAFLCSIEPDIKYITILPTPVATATVSPTTICNVSSPGISVKGNITDAATTFSWTRSNFVNVTGTGNATPISSGAIAIGGTYLIPGTLTNVTGIAQTVTYYVTPVSNGCSGATITVDITVNPDVTAGAIGTVQTICNGTAPSTLTNTTAGTGLGAITYEWQTNASGSYLTIGGATGATYSPPALTATTSYQRRTVSVSGGQTCYSAYTAPVTISVNAAVTAGAIGTDQVICNGFVPLALTSTTNGSGSGAISYEWQTNASGSFATIGGATGATYSPPALTATTSYQRRTVSVSGGQTCYSAYTTPVTITVNASVTAGTIGTNQTICNGTSPSALTSTTNGTGSGVISYEWQTNASGSYVTIGGATGATYSPPALTATTSYQRRTVSVSGGTTCYSAYTTPVTITVISAITAGTIGGNITICSGGDPAAFTITPATGIGITYQWQYSLTGGAGPWTDVSGATSATYDAPGPITQNTYYQRVVKASANGQDCYAYSGFVVVFVNNVTASVVVGDQTLCSTVDPAAFTVVTPATGTVAPTYQWQSSTTDCNGPWNPIVSATNAAYDPPAITQTTYYQVVVTSTLNGIACSATSNCITVISLSKSWNGSISTDWDNPANWTPAGIPDATNCVIIPNTTIKPSISGTNYNAFAYSLTVLSGGKLLVKTATNNTITVTDRVNVNTAGSLTFEDTASLVQINNVTNTGNITYDRQTTKIIKMDYTYWSTPVMPFTLGGVSPNTSGDKMYSFDSSVAPDGDWAQESPATPMVPGVGYIVRGPQNYVPPVPASTYEAHFVGVPNNGPYSISGIIANRSYLLGNPYPSALDGDTFLDANQNILDGTLYFWTHNTPIAVGTPDPGSGLYAYSGDDYASYNRTGGVSTKAAAPSSVFPFTGLNSNIPTGKIASGQGFFAGSKAVAAGFVSGTPIAYSNTMRVGVGSISGNNSQFYKTKNLKTTNVIEKHRIWLDLTNPQGAFKQTLVGYVTDASNDYEGRFDGESYDGNDFLDFYSILQDKNLTIQGRALPFDENDEIPLGYRVAVDGTFSVAIGQTDGLLSNQPVFIEDKLANTIFDLKGGKYTFTTTAGTFDDRFVLRYKDKTLSTEEPEVDDGIIVLYSNNYKTLIIRNNIKDATVNSVTLYNLIGQKIAYWDVKGREQSSIQIPIKNLPAEIYIVKVKTTKGESSKKIIVK